MSWIANAGREFVALFIDDGSLALLSLLWLVVCGFLLPHLGVSDGWLGGALFIGLVAILAESTLRAARRKRDASRMTPF